jgi:NAD(P)H dehydrogenase (quinone)
MAKVLVIYHSRTGNTEKMAASVAEGARVEGVEVELKKVGETKAEEMLLADGIIVGSPVYYGLPAAEIKALFDESVKFHGKLAGKVGGAFASSGNVGGGNETTILAVIQMMLIHGMIVQGNFAGDHYGPVSVKAPDERALQQCEALGRRVAQLAVRISRGGESG